MSAKAAKFLVTIDEQNRKEAEAQVRRLLKEAGAKQAVILHDPPEGVVQAWVPGDPRPLVRTLEQIFTQDPHRFAGTHRWVPVESWAHADARDLSAYARLFRRTLREGESWRINVERHATEYSPSELLKNIRQLLGEEAGEPDEPDRTLHISILGERLGFADLERGGVLDASLATSPAPPRTDMGH